MRAFTIILTAASVTACSTPRTVARDRPLPPTATSARIITGEEIARRYHDGNLLDALRGLRGRLLAKRGPDGTRWPPVYLDGLPLGSIAELAAMRVDIVKDVRYLIPSEATTFFGSGHTVGAILVTSVSGAVRFPGDSP